MMFDRNTEQQYEVVVVGGSMAGLSAALVLGRSLRRVLVIDSGRPCNRQTPHSHSYTTRDGESPAQLLALARQQALAYPTVSIQTGRVAIIRQIDGGFLLTQDSGEAIQVKTVLLATGLEDIMPPIDSFAECWGRTVLHCPYCHGYEVRNQPMGVLLNNTHTFEYTTLIRHWSQKLTLFTNGPATLTDEQRDALRELHVPIVETPVQRLQHEQGTLSGLTLADGTHMALNALFAPLPFRQHSDLAQQAGCTFTDTGLIVVSPFGETGVAGLYAAGDNSSPMRQLSVASASGGTAAAFINRALVSGAIH